MIMEQLKKDHLMAKLKLLDSQMEMYNIIYLIIRYYSYILSFILYDSFKVVYHFGNNGAKETKYPDGKQILEFPNQQKVILVRAASRPSPLYIVSVYLTYHVTSVIASKLVALEETRKNIDSTRRQIGRNCGDRRWNHFYRLEQKFNKIWIETKCRIYSRNYFSCFFYSKLMGTLYHITFRRAAGRPLLVSPILYR